MTGPVSRVRVQVIAGEHTGRFGLLLQANTRVCLVELDDGQWALINGDALASVGPQPDDSEAAAPFSSLTDLENQKDET